MSWLELDDGILRHPKFIRAVRIAGSEAIHMWLGLRAYCGQQLTDGKIPTDMIDVVDGPANDRRRAAALDALVVVGLLETHNDGLQMHDYLDWSSSRAEVEARRASSRDRKRRSRGNPSDVTTESQRRHGVTDSGLRSESQTPARADPLPSPPLHTSLEKDPSAAPPPSVSVPIVPADFLRFWNAITSPRRKGERAEALEAWKRAGKPDPDYLIGQWNFYLASLGDTFPKDVCRWLKKGIFRGPFEAGKKPRSQGPPLNYKPPVSGPAPRLTPEQLDEISQIRKQAKGLAGSKSVEQEKTQ